MIKTQYKKQYEFYRNHLRFWFLWCLLAFFVAAVVSSVLFTMNPDQAKAVISRFIQQAMESGMIDETGEISTIMLLINNVRATITSTVFGFIPFLFLPAWTILSNGAMTGAAYAMTASSGGDISVPHTMLQMAAGILPHGIFEIPAFLLGASMGVLICRNILCRLVLELRPRVIPWKYMFANIARVYLTIVIPALIIAALIENNITPLVMQFVG